MIAYLFLMFLINAEHFISYKQYSHQISKWKYFNANPINGRYSIGLKGNKVVNESDLLRSRSKLLENVINRLKKYVLNIEEKLQNEVLMRQVSNKLFL